MSLPGKRNDKTKHRYVEDRLSAYVDGQLSLRERGVVEGHLAQCEECQWNFDTLQQTVLWVRELPPVPVPRAFTVAVPAQPARSPTWRWSVPLLQGATAVAALLLFFVVAGDLMLTAVRPGIRPALAPAAEVAVERESVDLQAAVPVEPEADTALEPALEVAESMPVPESEATAAPLPSPEPVQLLELEAKVADPAEGAGEMEMPVSEAEEEAVVEAGRVDAELAVEEKAAAAPAPASETATNGSAETEAVMVEPSLASSLAPTILPPTAAPVAGAADTSAAGVEPSPAPPPTATVGATHAPTVVAKAERPQESAADEQHAEQAAVPGQPPGRWLGLAEIILGVALVLLATTTAVAMIQRRRLR